MIPRKWLILIALIGIGVLVASALAFEYRQFAVQHTGLRIGTKPYNVTFLQLPVCGDDSGWGEPWAVTLGGQTKSQPPNTLIVHDGATLYGTRNASLSEIVFSATNGVYPYEIAPADLFSPSSGVVNVDGSSVTVQTIEITQCPTSTTTATSP